ncbi:hypothetical protein DIPPA_06296 [Diplonema papillatum]|nr:hypothetical protein DIPPA_06296 [Diplonema papillatum]
MLKVTTSSQQRLAKEQLRLRVLEESEAVQRVPKDSVIRKYHGLSVLKDDDMRWIERRTDRIDAAKEDEAVSRQRLDEVLRIREEGYDLRPYSKPQRCSETDARIARRMHYAAKVTASKARRSVPPPVV